MMHADNPDAQGTRVAAGAQAATSAAVAMPLGVDVSSWQHPTNSAGDINWGQVAASGQSFAIIKATEGDYYTNPFLTSDLTNAHNAGLVVGAYAYAIPSISPTTQADMFANAIRSMPSPHLPPVLDLEETGGLDTYGLPNWTNIFLTRLAADTGQTPMIYVSPYFWKTYLANSTAFGQYALWEAHYTANPAPDPIGAWGSNWSMWQFTSTASVPGIAGNVDQNRFNTSNGASLTNLHGPVGSIDSAGVASDGTLTLSGWALDPDTPTTAGTVHVYLDGQWNQAVTANGSRPDVGAAFPAAGPNHGFTTTAALNPGTHSACVYAIDTSGNGANPSLGCRTVTFNPNLPIGSIDSLGATGDGTLTVSGWSFDPDTPTTADTVNLYVDGQLNRAITANGSRPDVGTAFPAAGASHGFAATAALSPGTHSVCVSAVDTRYADLSSSLGCRSATVVPNLPTGSIDYTGVAADGTLTVSGWTFDPDTPTTAGTVHVYLDGQWNQAVTANGSRPDVGAAFPAVGPNHGFATTAALTPGTHTVCVYAIDTSFGDRNSRLGCRTVTFVPNLPIGSIDSLGAAGDGTLTVSGWTFDPDTPTTAGTVHVYVDGQWNQAVTANGSRPDVGLAFPAVGPNHGFTATTRVSPGKHTVCLYAIDTTFAGRNSPLGCRTATVVPNLPIGSIDSVAVAGDGTLTVSGWTFDPDTPTTAGTVHLYLDGQWNQAVTANGSRPDVGAAFPAAGPNHGFTATTAVSTGKHSVCLYAIDTSFPDRNSPLGCRSITR